MPHLPHSLPVLLAATCALGACGTDATAPVARATLGRIEVTVNAGDWELGAEFRVVARPDAGAPIVLPLSGTVSGPAWDLRKFMADVPPGTYVVGLSGMRAACRAEDDVARTVTVRVGAAERASFSVVCDDEGGIASAADGAPARRW